MITADNQRAAPGLIDWTRKRTGQGRQHIARNRQKYRTWNFRPQEETSETIVRTFAAQDVVFTEGEGVKISKELVRTFVGREGYIRFLDDICDTMRNGGRTCQFNFSDLLIENYGGSHLKTYSEKMAAVQNLSACCLVPEGDVSFPVKHCSYKWLGK